MKPVLTIAAFVSLLIMGCNNNENSQKNEETRTAGKSTAITEVGAAKEMGELLCQNWENKEDAEDAALSGAGDGLEMPYRGVSFFEDGMVTEGPRDKLRIGKWKLDESTKTIQIAFKKGGQESYQIESIEPLKLVLVQKAGNKKMEYRADGKVEKNVADDPFHPANNQWRIKPTSAESDSALKLRTADCLLFYSKFLADNAAREARSISFVGLPTCFTWYRGGVSVISSDKLGEKWFNCFYNRQQGLKAQAMVESIISKKYKWNKEEPNWVKQSADVVYQMYDTLKALKGL